MLDDDLPSGKSNSITLFKSRSPDYVTLSNCANVLDSEIFSGYIYNSTELYPSLQPLWRKFPFNAIIIFFGPYIGVNILNWASSYVVYSYGFNSVSDICLW
jgi:hypothetical protein